MPKISSKKTVISDVIKVLQIEFLYISIMNLQAEINWIKSELDSLQDVSIVNKLKEIIRNAKIKRYEASLKPMTQEELIRRAEKSEADIKAGRLTTIEELEKESENW